MKLGFKHKKGMGLSDLTPIVMTITIIALILAVILYIFSSMQTAMPGKSISTINESFTTMTNETLRYTANTSVCGFRNWVVSAVYNGTGGALITSDNYTVNPDTGSIIATATNCEGVNGGSNPFYCGWDWEVTATYTGGTESCDVLDSITGDFVDFIPWIGIILLIVAAAIVLGIVIRSFKTPKV